MLQRCPEQVTDVSDVPPTCYEEVGDKLRACYEKVTRNLLP